MVANITNWVTSWGSNGSATSAVTYSGASPVMTSTGNTYTINWTVDTSAGTVWKVRDPNATYPLAALEEAWYDGAAAAGATRRVLGVDKDYLLPDGAKLVIDHDGNYKIDDKDAKVIYKANRVRDFSPHINASEMLAQFVEYVGTLGVRQTEVLTLPIELFINWLIITAAERDHDPVPEDVVVADHKALVTLRNPRCLYCQRFITRLSMERRFPFCNLDHGGRYLIRVQQGLAPKRLAVSAL